MTIKEIADLCGVDERTALRWVRKVIDSDFLNDKMSLRNSVKEKLEIGVPAKTLTS
jgi:DNA-binding MurR/RpiR family transcriptional regulator